MSNSITPLSPTFWAKRAGKKLYKEPLFRSVASFEEQAVLTEGQKVDRPYRSNITVENYTKGTALTAQDLTATSDVLTVDVVKAALFYVDNVDKIQNKWSSAKMWSDELGTRLVVSIDARFLYEAFSAADTIDDGDIGGSAGNGLTLSVNNILNVFAKTNRKLDVNNVPRSERFFIFSPQFFDVLWQYIAGKESLLGDKTGEHANVGTWAGFKLYLSNNLTGSAQWVPADNPANAATITINGIVFTFVSSIGSTPGNVLIGANTAATIDNLVALINAGGVTSDAGVSNVSLSTANQRVVQDWVAVDGTTYIEVRAKGASYMTVATSEAADVWTAAKQIQHCLAGRKGAIDAVIQQEPMVDSDKTTSAGKWGMNFLGITLFGVKTFNQGANEILDVQIRSDAY